MPSWLDSRRTGNPFIIPFMDKVNELNEIVNQSPAFIYRLLSFYADQMLFSRKDRENLEIVIDIHWFFLYSKYHREQFNYKKHIGKWKYDAISVKDLLDKVLNLLPSVASGDLPVVKFTNIPNVNTGEKLIVAYCFPFGPSPAQAKDILAEKIGTGIYWGSFKFKEHEL